MKSMGETKHKGKRERRKGRKDRLSQVKRPIFEKSKMIASAAYNPICAEREW